MNKKDQMRERYALHTVDKAISVLDLFFQSDELGAADVAGRLGITRNTAFRFLTSLEKNGLLIRTSKARYRLGLKLFSLGQIAYSRLDLTKIAHPHLQALTEATGETSLLAISDGKSRMIYLDRALPPTSLRLDTTPGTLSVMHQMSGGKAILAFQSDDFINAYMENADFSAATEKTITSPALLWDEIRRIRQVGYACDNEESEYGLICYGAPILDESSVAIAGVSITGPVPRMLTDIEGKISAVKKAARGISDAIK